MSILFINNSEKVILPVEIYSEQAGIGSGTWRVDVLNGNPSVQYKIRGTASFNGTGMSISFTNLNLAMLDTTHTTKNRFFILCRYKWWKKWFLYHWW